MKREDDVASPPGGNVPPPPVPGPTATTNEPALSSGPTSTPRTPNPRPPNPSLGPPASDPEPELRRPHVRPNLGMAGSDEGGTFALPGSRGARPFRSGAFGEHRGMGRFGPGMRFEGGFSGLGSVEGSGMTPLSDDDLYRSIAERLMGGE